MQILICPDSFKGCLSAFDVALHLEKGLLKAHPEFLITKVPLADGGEGTVETLVKSTGGSIIRTQVHDPLMRPIPSFFGVLGNSKTVVIEMAASSGLHLISQEKQNLLKTTSYGLGELISEALDKGCNKIIVGLGGSATNDAGAGMAQALGVRLTDKNGNEIEKGGGELGNLHDIDISGLDPKIKNVTIIAACDVTNPLTGENGASLVYGPQKGGDNEMLGILDANLHHFAQIVQSKFHIDIEKVPGGGAAGGLGAGLMAFLEARLKPGFDIVKQLLNLDSHIKEADLIITGEGRIDHQTLNGKAPYGIVQLARRHNKPVAGIAGTLGKGYHELLEKGFSALFSIVDKPMDLEDALVNAGSLLESLGENLGRVLKMKLP